MNEEKDQIDVDDMTIEQLKEYYDKGGARRIKKMDAKGQQSLFKKFIEEENKKKQQEAIKAQHATNRRGTHQLRNRSIKTRQFGRGSMNMRGSQSIIGRQNPNESYLHV